MIERKYYISRQLILFFLTSGFAAIVNFISRIMYNKFVDYPIAIILAYITGMITAFTLAKLVVFRDSVQSIQRSALYFIVVNIVAFFQTWIISIGLAYYVLPYFEVQNFKHEISHAIGLAIPVFSSYFGHKKLTFKSPESI